MAYISRHTATDLYSASYSSSSHIVCTCTEAEMFCYVHEEFQKLNSIQKNTTKILNK
jgi:hypothetical protein